MRCFHSTKIFFIRYVTVIHLLTLCVQIDEKVVISVVISGSYTILSLEGGKNLLDAPLLWGSRGIPPNNNSEKRQQI